MIITHIVYFCCMRDSSRTNITSATDNYIQNLYLRRLLIRYVIGNHIIWLCSTSPNAPVICNYSPQPWGPAGTSTWDEERENERELGYKWLVCITSSKLIWVVLLPARMMNIHPKMKALEWSQHFSHYKSIGIFPDTQGQLTH